MWEVKVTEPGAPVGSQAPRSVRGGKFRSPGGILSLSAKGELCAHRFVERQECLFTLN